ncbi:MAG: flagellar biosynthesis protein FlhA [Pseudomonadota bacterium]
MAAPGSGILRSTPSAYLGSSLLPVGILAVVAMMVLPLPLALLDTFFVFNILLSLLVLMVSLYSYRPLDFSSFPSVLLIATVLRLALNVASTRIVLTSGHEGGAAAGQVIEAFGNFVIAGNFAVGIVVFIILVIINLVVITKGAGRVSEVSARFTLDAMPGKQMAIDADLNAGLLTPEQARARRAEVSEEADFYGAMDGASKFVKGDAIAGILILLANIIGGIAIGTSQHGLALGDAAQTYVLLSIGDGLVAQIPSLLLSIATAVIVTRVASTNDMADHIGSQIGLHRAWVPVAGVLAIMGIVPGMPNTLFLLAASAAGGVAWVTRRQLSEEAEATDRALPSRGKPASAGALPPPQKAATATGADGEPEAGIRPEDVTDYAPITIQIGLGLIPLIEESSGGGLVSRITGIRRDASRAMGFVIPGVRIRDDMALPTNSYRIRIRQATVAEDTVYPDRKLALPGEGSVQKLRGIEVKDPSFGMDAVWIRPPQQNEAEADDHVVVEPDSVIATHLSQMLYAHAAELLGSDDVQDLLDNLERSAPTLLSSVIPNLVPLHVLTAVLRALLRERMPVADLPSILEELAAVGGKTSDPAELAEHVRPALAPQLLEQVAPLKENLPVITLAPELEELLTRSHHDKVGLVVDQGLSRQILGEITAAQENAAARGRQSILVVSGALRRSFSAFLRSHGSDGIVLGIHELPENRQVEIIASIGAHVGVPASAQSTPGTQSPPAE